MFAYLISLCIIHIVMKTKITKPAKKQKVTIDIKKLRTVDPEGEEDKVDVLNILPKKPSPRSPKFQDSEYISELDRDFGFDLSQDPLAEDL